MRVTCPTCETVYEVPPGQLPESGRHVQCSNCHTRWFARPEPEASEDQIIYRLETRAARPRTGAAPAPEPARPADPPPKAAPEPAPDPEPEPAAQAPAADPGPAEDFVWESAPSGSFRHPAPITPPVTPVAPARPVRSDPPAPVRETRVQPARDHRPPERETPAPAPAPRPSAPEHLRGELAPPPPPRPSELPPRFGRHEAPAAAPEVSRLDGRRVGHHPLRLEIPGAAAEDGWDREGLQRPQSRFGRGFLVALLIAAAALGLYGYDRVVVARAPALAPAIEAYVGAVDQMREAISPPR